jgi:hypothetical protein
LTLIASGCSSSGEGNTTKTSTAAEVVTTTAAQTITTTTAPTSTTAAPATATAATDAAPVSATPIVGVLTGSSLKGEALFPPESVEAHWYQWDGLYVVLYRGFDASAPDPICAGNSILEAGGQFASGVYACGALLYYITEMPPETVGKLFGTLEIVKSGIGDGQSSIAESDIASTPEFESGLASYELPPSNVDGGGTFVCS